MTTINRYRGDTVPDQFTITDSLGAIVNITGYTFLLTVNTNKDPTGSEGQLMQIDGVITDAPNGKVGFSPTALQADQPPGKYYYDVQMTIAGGAIQTIVKGIYKIVQDITK